MYCCEMCQEENHRGLREKIFEGHLAQREIILNGVIDEAVIEMVTIQILRINADDNAEEAESKTYNRKDFPITIFINSAGGLVDEGLSVVSAIESSKTPIFTVALGKAVSMGFLILIAGHRRFCQKTSRIMYHQLSSGRIGNVREIEEHVSYLSDLQDMIEQIVTEKTLIPKDVLENVYLTKQDMYIDAATALEYGIVDEVI